MRNCVITYDRPINAAYAEEIEKRLYFVSSEIEHFKLLQENGEINGIELTAPEGTDFSTLEAKINSVISTEITTQKIIPSRQVWCSAEPSIEHAPIFDQLLEKGLVYEMGEGQLCFAEPLIEIMDELDARIKKIVSAMGGEEYRYPTLIATKTLEDCGYFDSFPQMLMFVTRLHNDVDTYRAFSADYEEAGKIGAYALHHCNNTDYCLPPTMCYHTYQHLKGTNLGDRGNRVITSKGKSFRYESKYCRTIERLFDFTIREIVFMGTKQFVLDSRQQMMEAAFALVDSLGLSGHCEVANDPFFCKADTAAKILNQRMLELKYELRLHIEDQRTIAAASFNFHEQFFGERFLIQRDEDNWASTGCVGFGLERLLYAFLCQHGLDSDKWKEVLYPEF
ncbi:hypothetical protein [Paenibacillus sp. P46E]|uniref:hypothetical protein n=1 Tax=Paenibacillus sp. P46E TaxID=1349436 RepID=UPI00093A548F|nr:hypothetical protein [Paenibacillus sp. P46E]OKP97453.1 hypothetical protein A3849_16460 [Paenibacillus sp. P46E]